MPARKRSHEDMDEGARKKLKPSRGGERSEVPPSANIIDISSDRDIPAEMLAPAPLKQEDSETHKTLQLLHADFDSLRSLVTCKICERLLYEPYVLSCGHTYCYSCLCTWFQGKKRKTCPNCRDDIRQMPAPSYVIKEMTTVFVGRSELLPDGETLEQHAQWQKEEAEIVQNDKAHDDSRNGGLFKGSFKNTVERPRPILDREDNVERCPACGWELEDGLCGTCGYSVHDADSTGTEDDITDDLSDELDDEDDIDLDDFDAHDVDFGAHDVYDAGIYDGGAPHQHPMYMPRFYNPYGPPRRHAAALGDSDDEDEDEDDDDETSLNGFIDDEADLSDSGVMQTISSDVEGFSSAQSTPRIRRRRVVIDSDDDDEGAEDGFSDLNVRVGRVPNRTRPQTIIHLEEDDSDSGLESMSSRLNAQPRRGPAITIVNSDDEDLDSDSGDQDSQDSEDPEGPTESVVEELNMLQHRGYQADDTSIRQLSDDEVDTDDVFSEVEQSGFSPMRSSGDEEDFDEDNYGDGDERSDWAGNANDIVPTPNMNHPRLVPSWRNAYLRAHPHPQTSTTRMPGFSDPYPPNMPRARAYDLGNHTHPSIHAAHRDPSDFVRSVFASSRGSRAEIARAPVTSRHLQSSGVMHSSGSRRGLGDIYQVNDRRQYSISAESESEVGSEIESDSRDADSSDTMEAADLQQLTPPIFRANHYQETSEAVSNYLGASPQPMTFGQMIRGGRERLNNQSGSRRDRMSRVQSATQRVNPAAQVLSNDRGYNRQRRVDQRGCEDKPRPVAAVVDLVSSEDEAS